MNFDVKEALKTRKQVSEARQRLAEAYEITDWQSIVQTILGAGSSSPAHGGPVGSLINTLEPKFWPVKPDHDPIAVGGEDAELLKRRENWVAIARERKMQPFLSSDMLTARAATEISSIQPARVREIWYRDHVRKILAKTKRGENKE